MVCCFSAVLRHPRFPGKKFPAGLPSASTTFFRKATVHDDQFFAVAVYKTRFFYTVRQHAIFLSSRLRAGGPKMALAAQRPFFKGRADGPRTHLPVGRFHSIPTRGLSTFCPGEIDVRTRTCHSGRDQLGCCFRPRHDHPGGFKHGSINWLGRRGPGSAIIPSVMVVNVWARRCPFSTTKSALALPSGLQTITPNRHRGPRPIDRRPRPPRGQALPPAT